MTEPTLPPGDFLEGTLVPGTSACTAVRGYLPLYAGGDLDTAQMLAVSAHLEGCPPCAAEARAAEAARRAIRTLAERRDGEIDVWASVRAELAAEGWLGARAARVSAGTPGARARRVARVGFAALATAAALAAGFRLLTGGGPETVERDGPRPAPLAGIDVQAPVVPVATPALPQVDGVPGGLRRAGPGEERLRYRALPFGERERGGAADGGWSLAGDRQLK
jgi:anti-sigma factor RsiW